MAYISRDPAADRRSSAPTVLDSLETGTCDHVTCAAGAWNGDGKTHLVTGKLTLTRANRITDSITLWKNLGRRIGS